MIFEFKEKIFKATENLDGSLTFLDVNVSSMKLSSLLELPWSKYSWSIKGDFYCWNNKLINLVGGPTSVGGNFDCSSNLLSNLEGCLTSIDGSFYCNNNELISLEGCPTSIKGKFYSDKFSHKDYLSYIIKNKINQLQSL